DRGRGRSRCRRLAREHVTAVLPGAAGGDAGLFLEVVDPGRDPQPAGSAAEKRHVAIQAFPRLGLLDARGRVRLILQHAGRPPRRAVTNATRPRIGTPISPPQAIPFQMCRRARWPSSWATTKRTSRGVKRPSSIVSQMKTPRLGPMPIANAFAAVVWRRIGTT